MKRKDQSSGNQTRAQEDTKGRRKSHPILKENIGESIDLLVEYLVDNDVQGIHPLIMGEVEKRLIIKVLERSRGNKLQAAKRLGLSRNTFSRKVQKIADTSVRGDKEHST